METTDSLLLAFGGIAAFSGAIWIVANAFKESIAWGIFSLLFPIVLVIYALMRLGTCKVPLIFFVVGIVVYVGGVVGLVDNATNESPTTIPTTTTEP
ncbi:MAG: hypothetical protein CMJ23_07835 [Phycisphaerae bacterium]|nr:hypothetical protein [Phycisphaerae bacterium]